MRDACLPTAGGPISGNVFCIFSIFSHVSLISLSCFEMAFLGCDINCERYTFLTVKCNEMLAEDYMSSLHMCVHVTTLKKQDRLASLLFRKMGV